VRHAVTRFRVLEWAVLLVLLGATVFEAAVALEWIPVGTLPGENARFEWFVMGAALLALLAGVVISLMLASLNRRSVAAMLFPVGAAALMVARYYTFDTYYLPSLTRYSESGSFPPGWVYGLAIAGAAAWLLGLAKPRAGFVLGALVIFLCTFTVFFFGVGK
jgi:hypothetical protein